MTKYYLSTPDNPIGPFSKDELSTMGVTAETGIREGEDGYWMLAGSIEALKDALAPSPELVPEMEMSPSAEGMKAQGAMRWLPYKRDHCRGNGLRQYSAQLWDVPWGGNWELACANMPNTVEGYYFPRPTRCINANSTGMWGEWDVPDSSCVSNGDFNAVIFLKHDIPIGLGHVGYGFKMPDGRWMYGSKETTGIAIKPGDPNGVFTEKGTKEQMFTAFNTGGTAPRMGWHYQVYKALRVNNPNPHHAAAMAEDSKKWGYFLGLNNCMNDAEKIINMYAGGIAVPITSSSPDKWFPNIWFKQIWGTERAITDPF